MNVQQNYLQAIMYFELAASQGSVPAQFNLGLIYDNGLGGDYPHMTINEVQLDNNNNLYIVNPYSENNNHQIDHQFKIHLLYT